MDQTTNLLDLQADREASRDAVVHVFSFACSPGFGSSAVSCKQFPNEGEFLGSSAVSCKQSSNEGEFLGSSAVSCKQSSNDGEFLDYQSSELRTVDSECFSTHSGGWDSKSPRIVNCPSPKHGGSGSDHEFSVELDPKSTNPQLSSWALNEDEKKSKGPTKGRKEN